MSAALVANGHLSSSLKSKILGHDHVIAVDGGLKHCHELGISPRLIVGDFDSCLPQILNQYPQVEKIYLQKDKDKTDLEEAVEATFRMGVQKITLYGAWGGRIDHSLTNALLLVRYGFRLRLETETEEVFSIERETLLDTYIGQTISLIPLCGPVTGITTSGLKWELLQSNLDQNFIGISNKATQSQVSIQVASGHLLCCVVYDDSL